MNIITTIINNSFLCHLVERLNQDKHLYIFFHILICHNIRMSYTVLGKCIQINRRGGYIKKNVSALNKHSLMIQHTTVSKSRRREESEIIQMIVQINVGGKRGKLKKRWMDAILNEIDNNIMAVGVCEDNVGDRVKWKFRINVASHI